MATVVGDMLVNFRGNASSLMGALGTAKSALGDLGSGNWTGAIATGMVAIGGAAIGFGIASVSAAADFQESMDKVQAYAGLTKDETEKMGQSILQMAPQLGVAPKALADGLYFVASAGFKGADALNILKYAGMTAAASNVDASVTSSALVSALNGLGLKGKDAGSMMDILNATVSDGVLSWGDYGRVVGKMASAFVGTSMTASQMKSSFVEANAGLDLFTNSGTSARLAATNLNATINILENKTDAIAAHAKKAGIAFDEQKFKTMDLKAQMAYLGQITNYNSGEMIKLMGGNSNAAKTIDFLNANSKKYAATIDDINSKTKNGQTTQDKFAVAQQGLAFQMRSLQAAGQALMITIGDKLLPVVTSIVAAVVPVVGSFTKWLSSGDSLKNGLGGVGTVISGVGKFIQNDLLPPAMSIANAFMNNVVPAIQHLGSVVLPLIGNFISWAQNSGALHVTLAIVGGVVSNLVGFVGTLITTIANVTQFFAQNQDAATALLVPLGILGGYFVYLGVQAVMSFIAAAPAMIAGFITGATAAWTMAAGVIAATWPFLAIGAAVGLVIVIIVLLVKHWGAVSSFLSGVWHGIASLATTVWNGIVAFFVGIWNNIVNFVKSHALLLLAVITGPIGAIVILIVTHWNQIVSFLTGIWQKIISFVSNFVQGVITWIVTLHNRAVAWVEVMAASIVARVKGFVSSVISTVSGWVSNVVNWFVSLHNQAVQKVHDFLNEVTGILTGFINGAASFGQKLIQGIINGITGMFGQVGNTMHNLVGFIGSFLPHSPAKQGELSNLNRYGPALVGGFAEGITKSLPMLQTALDVMVKPVAQAVAYPIQPSPVAVAQASGASQQASTSSQGQTLIFQVDSHEMARMVNTTTDREVRVKLGSRSIRSS